MAGLALAPQPFARAGIGGGVDIGEGDLDDLLGFPRPLFGLSSMMT
jgi:hypothetical protein